MRFRLDAGQDPPQVVVTAGGGARTGRGAYVCPKLVCLERAFRRRAFTRAFRRKVAVFEDGLRVAFREVAEEVTGPMAGEWWRKDGSTS